MKKIIFWCVLITLIFLAVRNFIPEVAFNQEKRINLAYLIVLLSYLSINLFGSYSGRKMEALKHVAVWLAIGFFIITAYSFRNELKEVGRKVKGEIIPYNAYDNNEGEVSFRVANDGHFYIEASVNEVPLKFLVDTGATRIVLSPSDAKKLGFDLSSLNFTQISYTANGSVWGAPVKLKSIRIGGYEIRDVSVSVNGAEMENSLLGMAFLESLKSYSVSNGQLILKFY